MAMRIGNVGYWSGLAAFTTTVAYGLVQILQVAGMLRFPADEILIYGISLCIVVPFILEMLALHHLTPPGKQFWTHAALSFSIIYAVFVSANYVVQLATVIPAKLRGASEAIRVLDVAVPATISMIVGYGILAQRNPYPKYRFAGCASNRCAERRNSGTYSQDPPRTTFASPFAGPLGFFLEPFL